MITGFGTVKAAVEVTRRGAEGFITKPFQFEELRHELDAAVEKRRLKAENRKLRDDVAILKAATTFFAGELDPRNR